MSISQPSAGETQPPLYLSEPPGNPGTFVEHADGAIEYFFREGSWDDGFSSVVFSILTIDGEQRLEIPFTNSSVDGVTYVRFRSAALRPDLNGFYVEYVRAQVERLN